MVPRRLRLHHRIVIPLVLVALLTSSGAALVSLSLIRRALEARVVTQLASAALAVSRSGFDMNQMILDRVKQITGADVLTYTLAGQPLASTAPSVSQRALFATVTADASIGSAPAGQTVVRRTMCSGVPCYVAYTRVPASPDTVVALVEPISGLNAATRTIQRTILLSAALGMVVLVLASQVVARRVTRPLDRLVSFARDVASSSTRERAVVGNDEIGTLASAFNAMLDRLESAQDAVIRSEKLALAGLLAARVAHDIRNPLSSLKMQAQLLRSRVTGADGRAMIQAVLHDVDQVESVVRGLLELARPGEMNVRPAQLNDILAEVLAYLDAQLIHSNIAVSTDIGASLPLVLLDVPRFKQALLNVITNAVEAMPGGGSLAVGTRSADDASAVVLTVCDDGIGVDPAILSNVFDPFVSSKRDGVGLGLVNTRSIVESHGGRVHLAPRTPKGTCVTMTLPVPRVATSLA